MSGLAVERVGEPASPRVVWFVHGILGRGRNWRSFARRAVAEFPSFRALAVDLRCHGDTPPLPPPHDLAACAADLEALATLGDPPDVVIGHSFGGKVILDWARATAAATDPALWVLDSPPGPGDSGGESERILALLRAAPTGPAPADRATLAAPLRAAGIAEPIVQWLLTSAVRGPDGWRWGWDLDGIDALLADYLRTDLWGYVEATDREVQLVRAGRSDRWTADDRARFDRLSLPGRPGRVTAHLVPDVGHWLHVDDPEAVWSLLRPSFADRR
ncbi:MAG: alpha/beta hydrolase [Myxococcota bacterium]